MATISACAVGSFERVTRFAPSAMMRSAFTISAANGPPLLERTFSSASAMARFMNLGDMTCHSSVVQIVLSASNSQRGIFLMRGITYLPDLPDGVLRGPGLQESELAVGWCIALAGFALIFVQW